jgi:hypothetical protein
MLHPCISPSLPFSRWTKALVTRLAQGDQQLTVRVQGPYADPPAHVGQPDGVVLVAGEAGWVALVLAFVLLFAGLGTSSQESLCKPCQPVVLTAAPELGREKGPCLSQEPAY